MAKEIESEDILTQNIDMVYGSDSDDSPVVKIGETEFTTLADAVASVPTDNTKNVIVFWRNASGDGVIVNEGQNIVFDLNGHTYDIVGTVGSTGTKTCGFQLLKGSTVEIKNGTLVSATAKILLQNYCDLTLNNVTLDESGYSQCRYVVSNNFGSFTTEGETVIKAAEGKVAFDVYYGMKDIYDEGVSVNIGKGTSLSGKVEYGAAPRIETTDWVEKAVLDISESVDLSEVSIEITTEGVEPNIAVVTDKGYAQARQYQTTVTIDTGTLPQIDSASYKNKSRFIMNGDIRKDGKSVVAEKMVNDAHSFQTNRSVSNSFPSNASDYYKSLDFKVNE